KSTLAQSVDLLLQGHYHETDTETIVSATGGYLKLAAGASYQTRAYPNSAIYATFYQNQVTIFPVRYEDSPREEWTLDTSVFPSPSYTGSFPLSSRVTSETAEAKDSTLEDNSYLDVQNTLREELGTINLLGTHALENIPVGLTDTFVSLRLSNTWRSDRQFTPGNLSCEMQKEEQTLSPEEVMRLVFEKKRLLLVIGDPGSGKTTLLKHYALSCLDGERYKVFGFTEPVLVFFLPLRELKTTGSSFASLASHLFAWSETHELEIPEQLFADWLKNRKTLLLLDGLDEISDPLQRIKACAWIDRIVSRFTKARIVVTSRATGYRKGEGIELSSLHTRADIMDFTAGQQAEFLTKWFRAACLGELKPSTISEEKWEKSLHQKANLKAESIIGFLGKEENRSIQALAKVPMLLQIMAILWKEREYLPGSRTELYEAALNYILDYRDRQKNINPLLKARDALRVLAPVSLWMQEILGKDEVDRDAMQQQMQLKLNELTQRHTASDFCQNLVDRAGLLVEYRDKEYLFRHKSFREYLAGVQLNKDRDKPNRIKTLAEYFGNDWWEEPLRFFIEQVDAETFDRFLQELFDSPVSAEFTQKQQDLLETLIKEAPEKKLDALERKILDPETTLNRQRYIMQCLKTIDKPEASDLLDRFIAAGLTKERPDIARGEDYIFIPGGQFIYSVTGKPETIKDFFMAKFTVTNQRYRQFITFLDSKDVASAQSLPVETYLKILNEEAAKTEGFSAYLTGETDLAKLFQSRYDDDKRFNKDDQPVVGVSWYAAQAYCLWLSLLESNGRDTNCYRLPEEKEWEYAAAGKEGRLYPWGNPEPTPKLANYGSNEGATTPVGRYPEGATPEGLYDMAGNVLEWMENKYEKDTSARALRGGSWYYVPDLLRCSARYPYSPGSTSVNVGFRVV
ncbi:MAG: NACHT domain-containing protein, partial [Chlorobium sp.]